MNFDRLYSLEREEAEDLIKRHGGRVTGSVSKKTVIPIIYLIFDWFFIAVLTFDNIIYLQNYLLCDEDIGGAKSTKAKELGFAIFDPRANTIFFEFIYPL